MAYHKKSKTKDQLLFSLIETAIQTNAGYVVLPPIDVRQDKSIMRSADVIPRLTYTRWQITFKNGRQEWVGFSTLMMMLYVLRDVRSQIIEFEAAMENLDCAGGFKIRTDVSEEEVMKPEIVRSLLLELAGKKGMG